MDHLKGVQDYWDQRSEGFSDAISEEIDSHFGEEWTERFKKALGEEPLDVLDDGAGPGFFSMILAKLGHRVTAIDYSDGMLEQLKKNFEARSLKAAAVHQMDAQALTFADESFDAVVQRNVLWNLDHPEKAYDEIARVLRPGGIFILSDGNHYLAAHDEEYAAEREKARALWEAKKKEQKAQPGDHGAHNVGNVDFSIIEKIAVEQPLSYTRRPQWDLEQLIRNGFFDIEVKIHGRELPQGFVIIAKKKKKES